MSRVPDLITALVLRLSTEDGLKGVRVTDGPEITEEDADDWLLVGYDGDPDGDFGAAVTEEDWAGMSTRRAEHIELPLTVLARRGDADIKAARKRVYEIAAVVRGVLRADPSVGLDQTQVAASASALFQPQTQGGVQTRLVLTLRCDTFA